MTFSASCNNRATVFDTVENLATAAEAVAFVEAHTGPNFSANIFMMSGNDIIHQIHFSYDPAHRAWQIDDPWLGWRRIKASDRPDLFR